MTLIRMHTHPHLTHTEIHTQTQKYTHTYTHIHTHTHTHTNTHTHTHTHYVLITVHNLHAVVELYSSWCGICKSVQPTFRRIRLDKEDEQALSFLTVRSFEATAGVAHVAERPLQGRSIISWSFGYTTVLMCFIFSPVRFHARQNSCRLCIHKLFLYLPIA